MRTVICPGSFDPVTWGHVDYISRTATLFDQVIVAVLSNGDKKPFLSLQERMALLEDAFNGMGNIKVDAFQGLLVDYYREKKACAVVKGVRNMVDYEYENRMSLINKTLYPDFETVLLVADIRYAHLRSSVVMEILRLGGDITDMVPENVKNILKQKLKEG